MSIKRLNFTGRKRIPRAAVNIGVSGAPPRAIVGASFSWAGLGFPESARVVVEAQAGWIVQRFDFGTVGDFGNPSSPELTEFSSMDGVLFRVKVIGTGSEDGKLLGVADGIRPTGTFEEIAQRSFVIVRPEDLGDRLWKLDFDEHQPLLLVNSRLGDHQDFIKRREIAAVVLPEVLSQVLRRAAEIGETEGDDGAAWVPMALRMGARLAGRHAPSPDERDEIEMWTDEAAAGFSRRHAFLHVFIDASSEGSA